MANSPDWKHNYIMSKANDYAYRQIKAWILDGSLPPGSQLKEEEIAERCGLSRTPVRDAMRRLEAEMFVERTDSQRSFVYDWSRADLEELYTLRSMLETFAVERAAQRISLELLQNLKDCNQTIAYALAAPEPALDVFVEQNFRFHRLLFQAAGSERLTAMIGRLVLVPVMNITAQQYSRQQLEASHADHEELVRAFEVGDAQWASAIMTSHVRRALHVHRDATLKGLDARQNAGKARTE